MTRDEHLAWCKHRALEYIDRGEVLNGLTSIFSDLKKHPATENHSGAQLGMMLMMAGSLSSVQEARRFIEGFN